MPFNRKSFWIEKTEYATDIHSNYTYETQWLSAPQLDLTIKNRKPWIILSNGSELGNALASHIRENGESATLLKPNQGRIEDLTKLTNATKNENSRIIYLWALEEANQNPDSSTVFEYCGGLKLSGVIKGLKLQSPSTDFWGITRKQF